MDFSLGKLFEKKKSYRRIIAIGDIHGFSAKLNYLWARMKIDHEKDLVVFLGDYTDRGPNSHDVMKFVLKHKDTPNMVFLKGNHEAMFYEAYNGEKSGGAMTTWEINGGKATMFSLYINNGAGLIPKWCRMIEKMPASFSVEQDGKKFFFCHAGLNMRVPFEEQKEDYLLWDREFVTRHTYSGERTVVVGHTPSIVIVPVYGEEPIKPQILNDGKIILMDTGAFLPGGAVSAMDVLTGKIWQSTRSTTHRLRPSGL